MRNYFGAATCNEEGSQELQKLRLCCCAVNGPPSASERVDVEERRQVERSGVMDELEGENKTL